MKVVSITPPWKSELDMISHAQRKRSELTACASLDTQSGVAPPRRSCHRKPHAQYKITHKHPLLSHPLSAYTETLDVAPTPQTHGERRQIAHSFIHLRDPPSNYSKLRAHLIIRTFNQYISLKQPHAHSRQLHHGYHSQQPFWPSSSHG